MKKIKYLLSTILLAVTALGCLCGCGGVEKGSTDEGGKDAKDILGVLKDVQSAYENNLLSKADLEQIATYYNNSADCSQPLNSDNEYAVKETLAEKYHNKDYPVAEARAEDFTIFHYYGKYGDLYVVMEDNTYLTYVTVKIDYWCKIGDVKFHVVKPFFTWCCEI